MIDVKNSDRKNHDTLIALVLLVHDNTGVFRSAINYSGVSAAPFRISRNCSSLLRGFFLTGAGGLATGLAAGFGSAGFGLATGAGIGLSTWSVPVP